MARPQLAKQVKAFNLTVWVEPDDYDGAVAVCGEMGLKPIRQDEKLGSKICFQVVIPESPGWDKTMETEMKGCRAQLGYFYTMETACPPTPSNEP